MRKTLDLVILSLIIPSLARAQSPIVRVSEVPQVELEAYAEAHRLDQFSEHFVANRPGSERSQQLRSLTERAQALWLEGSVHEARAAFKQIAELVLEADWRDSQREAIHYALMRLAQSAPTPLEREDWLMKAAQSFPDLEADRDLFPPPLLERFRSVKREALSTATPIQVSNDFPDAGALLVNGKAYSLQRPLELRLPRAVYRITLVSDLRPPVTERLSPAQLQQFRPVVSAMATGTCDNPSNGDLPRGTDKLVVLFPGECTRIRTAKGWLPRNLDLARVQEFSNDLNELKLPFSQPQPLAVTRERKTWLWVGLGVIAAGAAWAISRELNREPEVIRRVEPVHREGF